MEGRVGPELMSDWEGWSLVVRNVYICACVIADYLYSFIWF